MSRTRRQMPRWVQRQITHTNNLVNGYRGVEYSYYGKVSDYLKVNGVTVGTPLRWRGIGPTDTQRNEENVWKYTTDSSAKSLRNCRASCEIGKSDGWNMAEACGQMAKRIYRRQWARDNRRWSAQIVREEIEMMEPDNEDDRIEQEQCANDYDDDEGYDYLDSIAWDEPYDRGYRDGYQAAMRHFHNQQDIAC